MTLLRANGGASQGSPSGRAGGAPQGGPCCAVCSGPLAWPWRDSRCAACRNAAPGAMRVALPQAEDPLLPSTSLGVVGAAAGGIAVLAAVSLRQPVLLGVPLFLTAAWTLDFLAGGVLIRRPRAERTALLAATFTILESLLALALRSGAIQSGGALAAAAACAAFILFASVRMLYEAEAGETVAILYLCTAPWLAVHVVLAPAFLFAN